MEESWLAAITWRKTCQKAAAQWTSHEQERNFYCFKALWFGRDRLQYDLAVSNTRLGGVNTEKQEMRVVFKYQSLHGHMVPAARTKASRKSGFTLAHWSLPNLGMTRLG